jgi:hypothetical protein
MTIWLFVFLPLYLCVPRHSALWRASVATPLGAVAGALAMLAWSRLAQPKAPGALVFAGFAAIVGGAACFVASRTAPRCFGEIP